MPHNPIEPRLLAQLEGGEPVAVIIECVNGAAESLAASLEAQGLHRPQPLPLVSALRAVLTPAEIRIAASNPLVRSIVWDRAEQAAT